MQKPLNGKDVDVNKIISGLFILIIIFAGCGSDIPVPEWLESKLLRVEKISPLPGEEIKLGEKISITFSNRVGLASVGKNAIFIMATKDLPANEKDIVDIDLAEADLIEGEYFVSEDARTVDYAPAADSNAEGEYSIVITNRLISEEGIPFGGGKPFVAAFNIRCEGCGYSGNTNTSDGSVSNGSSGNSSGSANGSTPESEEEKPLAPESLIINEIYYDVVGSDTAGDVFVELYGDAGGYLAGYYVALINGSDGKTYKSIQIPEGYYVPEDGIFVIADTSTEAVTNVKGADFLINFDPQNGPDTIQLIAPDGTLVDVIGYGSVAIEKSENGLAMFEVAPTANVKSGESLTRVEGIDTNDNSQDFIINQTPTPGIL